MAKPYTKTFQGERYQLRGSYDKLTLAKNVADGFKKRGWLVRVVELPKYGVWGVYIRRKHKRRR